MAQKLLKLLANQIYNLQERGQRNVLMVSVIKASKSLGDLDHKVLCDCAKDFS